MCLQEEVTKRTTVWVFIYNLTASNFLTTYCRNETLASRRSNVPHLTASLSLLENHLCCEEAHFTLIKSGIAQGRSSDTRAKMSFFFCAPTGQTAGSFGEALGGSPGDPAVTPSLGAQRPGALSRLASGAALCGVGEDRHHHPSGGAGHHWPADGSLRRRRGASEAAWVHLGHLLGFGEKASSLSGDGWRSGNQESEKVGPRINVF